MCLASTSGFYHHKKKKKKKRSGVIQLSLIAKDAVTTKNLALQLVLKKENTGLQMDWG
jgi:hypothetical protein